MPTKVIVSNNAALAAKYGPAAATIQNAIQTLIASDAARGIQSRYVAVDDAATMGGFQGTAVTDPTDPRQNKGAIDDMYHALAPDYILILGAPDVIPHQDVTNPLYDGQSDMDPTAWSDLPYACDAPYSQNAQSFIGPTRVVGRLPDITGGNDPQYLVDLMAKSGAYASLPAADFASYLGATASVWTGSTQLSLNNVFGNYTDLQVVPPSGSPWNANQIGRKAHFFNCHGADTDPHFYGQQGDNYPPALDAAEIPNRISSGVVLVAEACYGAQLYDPAKEPQRRLGMANTYLANGCPAYFGSTTIAYGDATDNANADFICQYFFESILKGASSGRAALEARQKYASMSPSLSPSDLKTLAQFLLLGDPSVVPVQPAVQLAPKAMDLAISDRRKVFTLNGRAITRSRAVASGKPDSKRSEAIDAKLKDLAAKYNLDTSSVLSYSVQNAAEQGTLPHALMARAPAASEYHVMIGRRRVKHPKVTEFTLLEVETLGDDVVRARHLVSR